MRERESLIWKMFFLVGKVRIECMRVIEWCRPQEGGFLAKDSRHPAGLYSLLVYRYYNQIVYSVTYANIQCKAASVRVVGILHSLGREERGVSADVTSKALRLLAAGRDGAGAVGHAPRRAILPEARATRSSVDV